MEADGKPETVPITEELNTYDDIIDRIGPAGKWQKVSLGILCIPIVYSGMQSAVFFFLTWRPDHVRCLVPLCDYSNITLETSYNQSWLENVIPKTDGIGFEQCKAKKIDSTDQCFASLNTGGTDGIFLEDQLEPCSDWVYDKEAFASTIVTRFNLVCSKHHIKALLGALLSLFYCVGSLLTTFMSDKYGRKRVILISMLITFTLNVGAALVPSLEAFMVLYISQNLIQNGLYMLPLILTMELMGKNVAGQYTLLLNISWIVGCAISIGLAWFIRDYDTLMLATTVPFFIIGLCMFFLPESPRWLLTCKREDDAKQILLRASRINGKLLSQGELATIGRINMFQQEDQSNKNKDATVLIKNRVLRRRLISLALTFIAIVLSYSGLSYNTANLKGNVHLNYFISYIVEIPSYSFSYVLLPRVNRRSLMVLPLTLSGLALVATFPIPEDDYLQWIKVALSAVGKFATSVAYAVIYIQISELFPTRVRSMASGICGCLAESAGLVAPFIADIVGSGRDDNSFWKNQFPLLVFGISGLFGAAAGCFVPETFGQSLPETVEDAEQQKYVNYFVDVKAKLKQYLPTVPASRGGQPRSSSLPLN